MRKIKEISRLTGWSDAYIRFLNTEIRRAGYNLIGTHEGMCLSDSLADRHYQVEKMLKQARDMEKTAELMLKGEHQELSEDAAALLALYPYRFGKDPNKGRVLTEEQKAAMARGRLKSKEQIESE